jgi:hypothetical protein
MWVKEVISEVLTSQKFILATDLILDKVCNMSAVRNFLSYRLSGLVVRVLAYRSRDPAFDTRRYQIF